MHWPYELRTVVLNNNCLEGSANFTQFPPSLDCLHLYLYSNHLSGGVDLSSLPYKIRIICLSNQSFYRFPGASNLPSSLIDLDLADNCFSGLVMVDSLHERLQGLSLRGNEELYSVIDKSKIVAPKRVCISDTKITSRS